MMPGPTRQPTLIVSVIPLLLISAACSTFNSSRSQKARLLAEYREGDLASASEEVIRRADHRNDTGDELMWRLEEGSVLFSAGNYQASIAAFDRAEKIIEDIEQRAVVSARELGAEGGAALTNPNIIPYHSNYAEKIFLNTYKALAYLGLGDLAGARVEIRRAHLRQKQARERFDQEIREAEESAKKKGVSAKAIMGGSPELQEMQKRLDQHANRAYGDFVNPGTTYLSAITYLLDNNPGEAIVDLRNLLKMEPQNPLFQRDLVSALALTGAAPPEELAEIKPWPYKLTGDICFILVENGLAPARREQRIHIPLPPPVGYTGVAFPVPEYFPRASGRINIHVPGFEQQPQITPIADFDSVMSRAYRIELPIIITRIAVSTIIKEGANISAQYALKDEDPWVRLLVLLAASLYKVATNRADVRSWQCLPGEYLAGHFPIPEKRRFQVSGQELEIPPGARQAMIWIKLYPAAPPTIRVFSFTD